MADDLKKKPCILMVGTMPPPVNGQSIAFKMLVDNLDKSLDFSVIDISDKNLRRDKSFTILRAMSVIRIFFSLLTSIRNFDVVYLTVAQSRYGFLRDSLILFAAHINRIPSIVHLHGGNYAGFYHGEPWLIQKIIKWTLSPVKSFVVLSQNLTDQFDFMGAGVRKKVEVIPNGCSVSIGKVREKPKKQLKLLYLSNLLLEKGFMDCIDSVLHIQRQLSDFEITLTLAGQFLLGEDEYASANQLEYEFNKHVQYMEIKSKIKYVGIVNQIEKEKLLNTHDIFLLPTYYINEGQPLSIIEAMAYGLPVISTNWRGIKEMLKNDKTGYFVSEKSPLEIANATVKIIKTPGKYEYMSKNAIKSVNNFTIHKHVKRMISLFLNVSDTSQ